LFAGEQFDREVGDYYLRQRYYDDETGRFIRRDTYEGNSDNPATLHRYLYAHGNPVSFVDPTGFFTIGEAVATVALASLIVAGAPISTRYLPALTFADPPTNDKVVLNIYTENAIWGHTSINVDGSVYSLEGRADEGELRTLAGSTFEGGMGWFYRMPESMWRKTVTSRVERYALSVDANDKQRIKRALDQAFSQADIILGDIRPPEYYRLMYYHLFVQNCNAVATESLPFQFKLGSLMTQSLSLVSPQHLAASMRVQSLMSFTGVNRLSDINA
jgi:RHS repeat-associated protein